ncbi:NADP-binding protein [Dacryopinax primogenitus]|uniref:NADP-binding protein n=1 Tax=Dacryopinax primogenitus (strain DJM 731) TaxID=1858805 RepID=M5FVJ0_DACPD|nr:NADP-binding protein [Dacryopinax primogenitus]EJT97351.1 NADP-binding protein [Dacryopinax primogenitus]
MSIPPLSPKTTLQGRSLLITGANSGLGFESARLALRLGASPVYITARTVEKGNVTRDELLADSEVKKKNPNAIVQVYALEMSKWDGVTSFAKKFLDDRQIAGEGLDIGILNAGLLSIAFGLAPTGNEMTIQVNHLSTALLALLLLPLLERSTTPEHTARLTIVSSSTHLDAGLKHCPPDNLKYLASLNDEKTFSGSLARYGLSKLLIILFLRELSQKVSSDKVVINDVCPGMIKTQLLRSIPWWFVPAMWVWQAATANPVERGAGCYMNAVANVGKESHGLWYHKMKQTPYSDVVTGSESKVLQDRIWNETMEQLRRVSPSIDQTI